MVSTTTLNALSDALQSMGRAILREGTRSMLQIPVLQATGHKLWPVQFLDFISGEAEHKVLGKPISPVDRLPVKRLISIRTCCANGCPRHT